MSYNRKWKPSKSAAKEFAQKMSEIDQFCKEHNISASRSNDSYYFTIDGQNYRVSNHSIEASNNKAYHEVYGKIRDKYHPDEREEDVIYIHASKTRIIDIYSDLLNGYTLDGRGNRKKKED